jgi:hypothetical protein
MAGKVWVASEPILGCPDDAAPLPGGIQAASSVVFRRFTSMKASRLPLSATRSISPTGVF